MLYYSINCNNESLCPGVCSDNESLFTPFSAVKESNVANNLISIYNESCNCAGWHRNTLDSPPIAIIRIITSTISILGAASIILGVLLTGKLSAAEVHPLFILSVADFILSILWMIGGIVWLNPGVDGWATNMSDPHTGMCYVLAIATTMMELVTFLLTAVYAQNALLRIREVYFNQGDILPEKDARKRFRHVVTVLVYIASWVFPLLIVLPPIEKLVGIESTNHGCWCVLDFFNLRPDNGNEKTIFDKFAIIHASILGSMFVIITLYIALLYGLTFNYAKKIIKMQTDNSENNSKGKELSRTILIRLSLFLIIFFVSGFPALVASILVWSEKERLHLDEPFDRVVLYIHAILIPLQGFLNAIVYGWSRREFRRAVYNTKEKIHYRIRNRDYESLNSNTTGSSSYTGSRNMYPKS